MMTHGNEAAFVPVKSEKLPMMMERECYRSSM
ncbi:hypothetical protein DPX39_070046600 [Trypanosoma brucei equiperdum]|uniref:Uncharacterized protein n=1 Tax=Trypanosoma brucei equiperdum TaxID=630700 RepID=A0A3L6L3P3_9TRYP|nr:hypothetical protein DPX39_070046600 [Trypanosoma brucei equiperdum]